MQWVWQISNKSASQRQVDIKVIQRNWEHQTLSTMVDIEPIKSFKPFKLRSDNAGEVLRVYPAQ